MKRLARLLKCTEGQAYTLTIGSLVAIVLTAVGVPPTFRDLPSPIRDAAAVASPGVGSAPPTTELVPDPPVVDVPEQPGTLPSPTMTVFVPEVGSTQPPSTTTTTTATETVREHPLRVSSATYARTPGPSADQPPGSVPVGARIGDEVARSYLRLAGRGTVLELDVVGDATATYLKDQATIEVCPLTTSDWRLEPGAPLEDAPPFDAESCNPGAPIGNGTAWSFDLSPLGDAAFENGVALVAVVGPLSTFQISFEIE